MYMYIHVYIYIYIYIIIIITIPLPQQIVWTSYCANLFYSTVLQIILGVGMGMNVTAYIVGHTT